MLRNRRSALLLGAIAAIVAATASSGWARATGEGPAKTGQLQRALASSLFKSPGFESLAAWRAYNGSLTGTNGGLGSTKAARVTVAPGKSDFSVYPASRPLAATKAGDRYAAVAAIRSFGRSREVCLRLREWAGAKLVGTAQSCAATKADWQTLPVVLYTIKGSGHSLDGYAYQLQAVRGDSFEIDNALLTRAPRTASASGAAPAGADSGSTAPTVLGAYPTAAPPPSSAAPSSGTASTSPSSGGAPATSSSAASSSSSAPSSSASSPVSSAPAPSAPAPAAPAAPAPAASTSVATASAVDNSHVRIDWAAVSGAVSYRVSRAGLVLGTTNATTFTDVLLWPETAYSWTVQALDSSGGTLRSLSASATTRGLPSGGFPRPFSPSSFWNSQVGSAATSPQNGSLISYFVAHAVNPNLSIGAWSVPVAEVHPSDPTFTVPCTRYTCTLSAFGAVPIPVTAKHDPSGDGHLAVYDPATDREWDFWQAVDNGSSWSASAGAAVSMAGAGLAAPNTGAGNAANFPLLGGLIRPEEILQGRIDHALVFGLPGIGQGAPVCPATHNASTSSDPNALREGARLQLDPSVNVDALSIPAWAKIVARAMQTYGMYLRDNSGSLGIYAENPVSRGYDPWRSSLGFAAGDDYPSLRGIPWDRFRVIAAPDYPSC